MDASRCRALLLEIVRRAIHDWVLYRNDRRQREKAEHAYTWLFEEKEGHPWHEQRKRSGMAITGFLTICEALDLEPNHVRECAKKMTPIQILTAGRPAERRTRAMEEPHYDEHGVSGPVSLSSLESVGSSQYSSIYEEHYAVYTSE